MKKLPKANLSHNELKVFPRVKKCNKELMLDVTQTQLIVGK